MLWLLILLLQLASASPIHWESHREALHDPFSQSSQNQEYENNGPAISDNLEEREFCISLSFETCRQSCNGIIADVMPCVPFLRPSCLCPKIETSLRNVAICIACYSRFPAMRVWGLHVASFLNMCSSATPSKFKICDDDGVPSVSQEPISSIPVLTLPSLAPTSVGITSDSTSPSTVISTEDTDFSSSAESLSHLVTSAHSSYPTSNPSAPTELPSIEPSSISIERSSFPSVTPSSFFTRETETSSKPHSFSRPDFSDVPDPSKADPSWTLSWASLGEGPSSAPESASSTFDESSYLSTLISHSTGSSISEAATTTLSSMNPGLTSGKPDSSSFVVSFTFNSTSLTSDDAFTSTIVMSMTSDESTSSTDNWSSSSLHETPTSEYLTSSHVSSSELEPTAGLSSSFFSSVNSTSPKSTSDLPSSFFSSVSSVPKPTSDVESTPFASSLPSVISSDSSSEPKPTNDLKSSSLSSYSLSISSSEPGTTAEQKSTPISSGLKSSADPKSTPTPSEPETSAEPKSTPFSSLHSSSIFPSSATLGSASGSVSNSFSDFSSELSTSLSVHATSISSEVGPIPTSSEGSISESSFSTRSIPYNGTGFFSFKKPSSTASPTLINFNTNTPSVSSLLPESTGDKEESSGNPGISGNGDDSRLTDENETESSDNTNDNSNENNNDDTNDMTNDNVNNDDTSESSDSTSPLVNNPENGSANSNGEFNGGSNGGSSGGSNGGVAGQGSGSTGSTDSSNAGNSNGQSSPQGFSQSENSVTKTDADTSDNSSPNTQNSNTQQTNDDKPTPSKPNKDDKSSASPVQPPSSSQGVIPNTVGNRTNSTRGNKSEGSTTYGHFSGNGSMFGSIATTVSISFFVLLLF